MFQILLLAMSKAVLYFLNMLIEFQLNFKYKINYVERKIFILCAFMIFYKYQLLFTISNIKIMSYQYDDKKNNIYTLGSNDF